MNIKVKMNITNFNAFRNAYYDCEGSVFLMYNHTKKILIGSHLLDLLLEKYYAQKRNLSIWCVCNSPSDYWKLLSCSAWEC